MGVFSNLEVKKLLIAKRLECLKMVEFNLSIYIQVKKFGADKDFLDDLINRAKIWGDRSRSLKVKIEELK